jgi:hypothetical protein
MGEKTFSNITKKMQSKLKLCKPGFQNNVKLQPIETERKTDRNS